MTLSAERKPGGEFVTVRACYGPITFEIDESRTHALYFWHELGKHVIDNTEDRARDGYGRYKAAFDARSEFGELPPWENLAAESREDWIAAFTE